MMLVYLRFPGFDAAVDDQRQMILDGPSFQPDSAEIAQENFY